MREDVVIATAADKERVIACLVTAFAGDPFLRWLFPDAHQYLKWAPRVFESFAGDAFDHASAYRSGDFMAAALWLPPAVRPDEDELGSIMVEGVSSELLEEMSAVLDQMDAGRPEAAHWYLPVMGVDPMRRGRGYGAALLACSLDACDRDRAAAYLESTNPANVSLYLRSGFEVIGEIQFGTSPVLTRLLRAAR
jgi:ribosomal protein S18 acetylase RimI-like enzyme